MIKDSIVMGADYYERESGGAAHRIGAGCHIEGAILDKNARIGDRVTIRPFPRNTDLDNEKVCARRHRHHSEGYGDSARRDDRAGIEKVSKALTPERHD